MQREVGHARAEVPDDSQDRAQLDEDLEDGRALAGEADGVADDDQVPGRGDRQELGQPLDDSEDEGLEQLDGVYRPPVPAAPPALWLSVAGLYCQVFDA